MHENETKGSRKNNSTVSALRFASDLSVTIEQNHRNSRAISRILQLKIVQR